MKQNSRPNCAGDLRQTADRFDETLRLCVDKYLGQKREEFECHLLDTSSSTDSPIEELMALGLATALSLEGMHGGEIWDNKFWYGVPVETFDNLVQYVPRKLGVHIYPQCIVGPFKADFIVCYAHPKGGYVFAAIECDGHDHHNLTKKQAQHDRERDRQFQALGIMVLRFTGSEIWKDPLGSALGALDIIEARAADATAARWVK